MSPSLYPWQVQGVKYLQCMPSAAFLAFSPRLGKTPTILAALPHQLKAPALVVCPKSAIGVWLSHAKEWRPDYRVEAPKAFRWPEEGELLVYNFERAIPKGIAPLFTCFIIDEATYVKSPRSLRTKRCRLIKDAVLARMGKLWLATGTPIERNPEDLLHLLEFSGLFRVLFSSRAEFYRAFGAYSEFGVTWWGEPASYVKDKLSRVILYKKKEDVLKHLPPKTREVIPVLIGEDARALCDKFQGELQGHGLNLEDLLEAGSDDMAILFQLRKELARAKLPHLLEWVEGLEAQEERILVFSAHREPVELLGKREGWSVIHGDVSATKRERICTEWRNGQGKGVALTIGSGKMAIDLSGASVVVFVDMDWNPGNNFQAEERACGPRQTGPVLIQYLVADHEVDETVHRILAMKQRIIEKVF